MNPRVYTVSSQSSHWRTIIQRASKPYSEPEPRWFRMLRRFLERMGL